MSSWLSPGIKNYHYFTLCSNEFVLFLVALGVGWERSRGEENENQKWIGMNSPDFQPINKASLVKRSRQLTRISILEISKGLALSNRYQRLQRLHGLGSLLKVNY